MREATSRDTNVRQSEKSESSIYIDRMANRLKEFDAEFREMKQKVNRKLSQDIPNKVEKTLDEVEAKRNHLASQLTAARKASSNAWGEIKTGLDAASTDLRVAFKAASERIKEAA